MKHSETIQDEVRKTLDFLDKMPKLRGNPFLYTRIQARLTGEDQSTVSRKEGRAGVALRFTLLALLIISNVATIVGTLQSPANTTLNRQQALSILIDDYSATGSVTSPIE
jgi:hypothetical protein